MTTTQTVLKPAGTAARGLGKTRRRDAWWIAPGIQAVLFTICATCLIRSVLETEVPPNFINRRAISLSF